MNQTVHKNVFPLLCMAAFTQHVFEFHPRCCVYQQSTLFSCLVVFHCMTTPQVYC